LADGAAGTVVAVQIEHGQDPATATVVKDQIFAGVSATPVDDVPITLTEYSVDPLNAAVGVNVATFVDALYAVDPATVPAADVTANTTDDAAIAWLNVADTAEDVATPVAPDAGTVAVTVGDTKLAVVNDHATAGEIAPPAADVPVKLTEYVVDAANDAVGVNVDVFVEELYVVTPATEPAADVTAKFTDAGAIATLNVADNGADVTTPAAPDAGTVDVTVGGTTAEGVNNTST
jgi:hypothetical protein